MTPDPIFLARELFDARVAGQPVTVPPSARGEGCDLAAAYAVEAELTRLRRGAGHTTVGRKVGYANRAVWRALKLQTLVWANMYDDTVHSASRELSMSGLRSPRIEPEVVVRLKAVPQGSDAAAVLAATEWIALGFEVVDCPYPDWTFQPADFVASFGLHAALFVGEPRPVGADGLDALAEQLATFRIALKKNGELVEEGAGKNALKSPALCVGELATAVANQPGQEPLRAGELISTGTLTNPQPIAAGETWTVDAEGLDLSAVTVSVTA
ncbi:MAG: decarboxylase [Acidimicrobiia bacterium]|nr:decarboxylase [Acidimicrobiia bacterium]